MYVQMVINAVFMRFIGYCIRFETMRERDISRIVEEQCISRDTPG